MAQRTYSKKGYVRISLDVEPDVHTWLQREAAERNLTMAAWLREIIWRQIAMSISSQDDAV